MIPATKHRLIAFILAAVFAVFNIGLPVVVASCPMMKYSDSKKCMMCDDGGQAGKLRFTNAVNTSCCVTVYAADRNKVEFLQSNQGINLSTLVLESCLISFHSSCNSPSPVSGLPSANASPPETRDIPILTSSLLI